jgi:hypothetical protein
MKRTITLRRYLFAGRGRFEGGLSIMVGFERGFGKTRRSPYLDSV